MLRRPRTSTLFPYTTLFRSQTSLDPPESRHCRHYLSRRSLGRRDRKSTRLNSSHANISYAVFCLKKKTTRWITNNSTQSQRHIDEGYPGRVEPHTLLRVRTY